MSVLGHLGEKEEQRSTQLLLRRIKPGVKQEKMQSAKQSKKTLKRYKTSPRRTKTRTVSCSTIYRLPEPRRPPGSQNKRKSWRNSACITWPPTQHNQPLAVGPLLQGANRNSAVLVHPGPDLIQFLPLHEQLVAPNTAPQPLQHIPLRVSVRVLCGDP